MESNSSGKITVLHVCNYAAAYRGNFIDSLCSLEIYNKNIKNIYLFPCRARGNDAGQWIAELNRQETVAYIQESNPVKNIFLLAKIIKKHRVDRIITHFADLKIDVAIKLLFNGKKVIRFMHGIYRPDTSSLKHSMKKFIWKNNQFVGVSRSVSDDLKQAFPGFKVSAVVNAIHFDRLENTDAFPKSDKLSLIMMGWDKERKGVDLALKAAERLQSKYDIVLQIVAASNEKEIREYIRSILGKEPEWVVMLPPTNNIATYYKASDIFLSPSRAEAFGYAVVEAAYCKNSIVASRVDGQGELQIDGAYWFESENVDDFTEKLEAAIIELNTPEKIAQKEAAKTEIQKIYSLEQWSKEVAALF